MKPKRLLALGVLLAGVAAIAPLTKAQKSAPPQPTEQQKLKERVDALESQLKDAQAKADRAAMEKDYILRTQNHYESYYKEVFSTQTHILWTIGITVTLLSVTLSVVFFVAGRFGFNIFDRKIDSALRDVTARLRTEFTETLGKETQALREANAAQLKQLEDDLNQRIEKRVAKLENETTVGLFYSAALTFVAAKDYTRARAPLRQALERVAKNPEGIPLKTIQSMLANLFSAIQRADPQKFTEQAKKELAADLYQKFENELNAAAIDIPELAQVLKERKEAPPSTPKS